MLQPPLASRTARKVEPSSETQPSAPGAPWPSLRDGQPGLDPRTAENARRHSLESPGTSPVLGTGLWSRPHHGADIQVAREYALGFADVVTEARALLVEVYDVPSDRSRSTRPSN